MTKPTGKSEVKADTTDATPEMTSNTADWKEEAQKMLSNKHTSSIVPAVEKKTCQCTNTLSQPMQDSKPPPKKEVKSRTTRPSHHSRLFLAPACLHPTVSDAEYNVMIDALVAAAATERGGGGGGGELRAEVADAIIKRFMGGDRAVGFWEMLRRECWGVDGVVVLGMLLALGLVGVVTR